MQVKQNSSTIIVLVDVGSNKALELKNVNLLTIMNAQNCESALCIT